MFYKTGLALAATPVLLFSDMTDGPTTGWEQSSTKDAAVYSPILGKVIMREGTDEDDVLPMYHCGIFFDMLTCRIICAYENMPRRVF